jgi:hypothetical protein
MALSDGRMHDELVVSDRSGHKLEQAATAIEVPSG